MVLFFDIFEVVWEKFDFFVFIFKGEKKRYYFRDLFNLIFFLGVDFRRCLIFLDILFVC